MTPARILDRKKYYVSLLKFKLLSVMELKNVFNHKYYFKKGSNQFIKSRNGGGFYFKCKILKINNHTALKNRHR